MLSVKKTRNWLLLCLVGGLLACATPPVNPWDSIEVPSEAIETPLPCDELPEPEALDDIGKGRIEAMHECAMANYDIASEHVTQIKKLRLATRDLIEAGQAQRRISDMHKQMLEEERRSHLISTIGWAALAVAGIAL